MNSIMESAVLSRLISGSYLVSDALWVDQLLALCAAGTTLTEFIRLLSEFSSHHHGNRFFFPHSGHLLS